jgi:AcrR family transcriptional regulator
VAKLTGKKRVAAKESTLRTTPRQIRGQERVTLILDVSEKLLLSKGYEALSTNAVAAEAGISIGSLYHFFADKVAILEALIERYNEAYFAVLGTVHQANKDIRLEAYLDGFLKALIEFGKIRPALLVVFSHALTASARFEALEIESTGRMTSLMGAYYQQRNPKLSEKKSTLVAWVVLTMTEALLLAIGDSQEEIESRYQETKRALKAYLELYL